MAASTTAPNPNYGGRRTKQLSSPGGHPLDDSYVLLLGSLLLCKVQRLLYPSQNEFRVLQEGEGFLEMLS